MNEEANTTNLLPTRRGAYRARFCRAWIRRACKPGFYGAPHQGASVIIDEQACAEDSFGRARFESGRKPPVQIYESLTAFRTAAPSKRAH
jgi:hypothetical protein